MKILTNVNTLGTTGVLWSARIDDLQSLTVKVNAIVGSTVVVEFSADNSSWSSLGIGQDVTAKPSNGTPATNAGSITATGKFWYTLKRGIYARVRVSTYVGPGNVVVEVEASAVPTQTVLRSIDLAAFGQGTTAITGYPIQAPFTRFTSVSASSAATLPGNIGPNQEFVVRNLGANALLIFPPIGGTINGAGSSVSLSAGSTFRLVTSDLGAFWTF